ncbi:hypothetical protein [Enemella sp. A6]|uniref:hypothetical protein n=1 Tax=Enemella sp. A6 TaxID=3440152 RepID=UPI003EB8FD7D
MPTYVLEGGAHAMLPAQPLTVRIRGAQVQARARRADGSDAPGVLNPGGGILVIPTLTDEVVVRAEPGSGQFSPGSVLDISVAPESRAEIDPDQATVSGVDVSGLSGRDLLRLEPHSGRVRVTALGIRVDTPLPPLAAAVRDAARRLLRVEAVADHEAVGLQVVVDASASTRALAEAGDLTAAMEVLLGLSRVISGDREFTAIVGTTGHTPATGEAVTLPGTVTDLVAGAALRTGFRPPASAPSGTVQIVLSDAPALTAPDPGTRRHGVLMAPRSTWPALHGRRSGHTLVPVAEHIGPHAGGPGLADQLLQDENLLHSITESLVRGIVGNHTVDAMAGVTR